jgi:hypothetical protein
MELFAYIDPFTGSLVLQVLAMAFFSVLVFFRHVKDTVLALFGIKPKESISLDEADAGTFSAEDIVRQEQEKAA